MRNDARENAFKLIFESLFHNLDKELSEENLAVLKKDDDKLFFDKIISSFEEHKDEIKIKIESKLKGYDYSRVYKIDLALIYLAITEVLYCDTQKAVAINEAVELSKKYSTDKSSKFVNALIDGVIENK